MSEHDDLDVLIERLLHAAVGHGNPLSFLRTYFRREIEEFLERRKLDVEARDE